MGKKPDLNRALTQKLCLLESTPSTHPINTRPTPSLSYLPPPLSPLTYFSYAKHASRRRSTVQNYPPPFPRLYAPQPPALPQSSPQRWLKNSPFPNPTSTLSRISYTPQSSCRHPRQTARSLYCPSFHGIGTSIKLGLEWLGWK